MNRAASSLWTCVRRGSIPASLLLWVGACGREPADSTQLSAETPVVLVIIDTLRADHLGCYGYEYDTSPVIDAFAEQAYVFEANSTQCNSTLPSITSIMTGLYPRTHRNYLPVPIEGKMELLQGHTTLAERMRAAGYATLAVISHPFWNAKDTGSAVRRGWDRYSVIPPEITGEARLAKDNGAYTNERVFGLLDEYEAGDERPLFLWAHYFDPHNDYAPPREWQTKHLREHLREIGQEQLFEELAQIDLADDRAILRTLPDEVESRALLRMMKRCMYDAEISYCDYELGRLFERLRAMGIYDDALIVLMADHGENMGDVERPGMRQLGMNHRRLFEGVVHVPLIVKLPGQTQGQRVSTITQSIDVMPTIVELLGLEDEPPMEGVSLCGLMDDVEGILHERVFIQSSTSVEKAVRTEDLKFIDPGDDQEQLLYRWRRDPDEIENIVAKIDEADRERLAQWIRDFSPVDILRLQLVPESEPYEIDLSVSSSGKVIEHALEVEGGVWSAEENAFRWSGLVADAPVDLHLFLTEGGGLLRVEAERRDGTPLRERVRIGQLALERTTALPIWEPAGTAAAGDARFLLARPSTHERTFELELHEGEHATIEVRNRSLSYKQIPVVELEGAFVENPQVQGNGVFKLLEARGPGRAAARVRYGEEDEDALALLRVDGGWPAADSLGIEGERARTDRLSFLVPYRRDKRSTATLLAGVGIEPPDGGAILLWLEGGASGAEIDTSELSDDELDQLRRLGYVR